VETDAADAADEITEGMATMKKETPEKILTMNKNNLNWETWLKNGDQYLSAATPKSTRSRFGANIRYNLLSMSLEGYIMAILDYHHNLPHNHTYIDLIAALETVMPVAETLKSRILQYENIQSICSIEKYHRSDPTEEELDDLKGAIIEISMMAHETCDCAPG